MKKVVKISIVCFLLATFFVFSCFAATVTENLPLLSNNTIARLLLNDGTFLQPVEFDSFTYNEYYIFDAQFNRRLTDEKGLLYNINTFWQASSTQELLDTGSYSWTFEYLSIAPPAPNYQNIIVRSFVNVSVVDSNLQTYSDELIAYTTLTYLGEWGDDYVGSYGRYRVSCSVLGVDLYKMAYSFAGENIEDVRVNSVMIEDSSLWKPSYYVTFGFSQNVIFQSTAIEDLSVSVQQDISNKLSSLEDFKSGVDTQTPNNDFDSASGEYGDLEDDILGSLDDYAVQDSIGQGSNSFSGFLNTYGDTMGFVKSVFTGFLNFGGIWYFVTIVLTFVLCGSILNLVVHSVSKSSKSSKKSNKSG